MIIAYRNSVKICVLLLVPATIIRKFNFSLLAILLFIIGNSFAQVVSLGETPASVCANETLFIRYEANGFSGPNTFSVELSDAAGSFALPIVIGTLNSISSDYIEITIPENTSHGLEYLLRIHSSETGSYSTNTSAPIDINCTTKEYYWVGNSGNWSDYGIHWATTSGGSVFHSSAPGENDNVFFDSNSFHSQAVVNLGGDRTIRDMIWADGVDFIGIEINGGGLTIKGDYIVSEKVKMSISPLVFNSYLENNQISFDSYNHKGVITFRGGGSWYLNSDFYATTNTLLFYEGTFNSNGYAFHYYNEFFVLSDNFVFNWGNSDVYANNSISYWGNSRIFNPGSSTFYFSNSFRSEMIGPLDFHKVVVSGNLRLKGNCTFDSLIVNPGGSVELFEGSIQIVHDYVKLEGNRERLVSIASYNGSSPGVATLSVTNATEIIANYVEVSNNTIDNSEVALVPAKNVRDGGGNNGWDFDSYFYRDFYWIGGGGNWGDISHWRLSPDNGKTHIAPDDLPCSLDTVNFTVNSFMDVNDTVFLDGSATCRNMYWRAGSGQFSPTISGDITITGNLLFDSGVNTNTSIVFESSEIGNKIRWTDNFLNENFNSFIWIQGGGSWELESDIKMEGIILFDATLNTNDFDLDLSSLILFNKSAILNAGSSTVKFTNFLDYGGGTFNAGFSTFISTNKSAINKPFNFYNLIVSSGSSLEIQDNATTIDLLLEPGSELIVKAGKVISVNKLSAFGTMDSPIKIHSTQSGIVGQISQSSGVVNAEYLILQDNQAIGGATFNAINSVDLGNVSGWNITPSFLWFADSDGDGYGDVNVHKISGNQPEGYVLDNTDCDDTDAAINPESIWYADVDGDGYGDLNVPIQQCVQPTGYVSDNTDCDDSDASINPEFVWYLDSDGDSYGNVNIYIQQCVQPVGYVSDNTDCDDSDADIHPELIWYADVDGDDYGDINVFIQQCIQPTGYILNSSDCDDTDSLVYPGADPIADGKDNNCDGIIKDNEKIITGISDISKEVKIYPNPATDIINIEWIDKTIKSGYILNILGDLQEIEYYQNMNKITFNIAHLDPGIYLIVLTFNDQTSIKEKVLIR